MVRLQTYAGFSFLATISAVYYAFSLRSVSDFSLLQ